MNAVPFILGHRAMFIPHDGYARHITGAYLADQIEAMLKRRPDVSPSKLGYLLRGRRSGINDLRAIENPKPETVTRVLDIIANPPPEVLYLTRDQYKPRKYNPEANQRRCAAIRRSVSAMARERNAKGLSAASASTAAVRLAQQAIEDLQKEQARLADPIEQAMTKLRRARRVVYRASVHGGPHNRFYISGMGTKTISERELLKMARAA
jgi:hypothetical protein